MHQGNSTNVTKNPNLKANKSTNTNQNYASNDYRQVYSNMKANNSKNSNHNYQTQEANDNNINSYREYNGYNNNANMRFDNQSIR